MQCRYSLAGLPPDGVCPECGHSIPQSVAHVEMLAAHRAAALPAVVRVFRSAYVAAFCTLIAAPVVLPHIARAMSAYTPRNVFPPVYSNVIGWTAVFALVLAGILGFHGRFTQMILVFVSLFLLAFTLPPLIRY